MKLKQGTKFRNGAVAHALRMVEQKCMQPQIFHII